MHVTRAVKQSHNFTQNKNVDRIMRYLKKKNTQNVRRGCGGLTISFKLSQSWEVFHNFTKTLTIRESVIDLDKSEFVHVT